MCVSDMCDTWQTCVTRGIGAVLITAAAGPAGVILSLRSMSSLSQNTFPEKVKELAKLALIENRDFYFVCFSPQNPVIFQRNIDADHVILILFLLFFSQMATCHACNKTSMHKGMSRDFIATLTKTHGTPGSAGKHKTPPPASSRSKMTTPKTPGKDKTPVHTSR